MGFIKTLFTGHEETEDEKQEHEAQSQFDIFKYDGIQAMRMGQIDYAIACFEHALDIQDDDETMQYYSNVLLHKGDIEEASEVLEQIHAKHPDDIQTVLTLAELYFQLERYDQMDEACLEAIQLNDSLATPYYIMAKKQNAQNDLINAVASATKAISKREDFNDPYLLRAKVLFKMQQFADAEKDADFVLAHQPEDSEPDDDVLMLKAEICEASGKTDEAKDFYQQVIAINPYATKAYMQLGNILHKEGKTKEAAAMVEEGLKLAPEEMQNITGQYNNFEDKMREAYNALNPYQLGVNL